MKKLLKKLRIVFEQIKLQTQIFWAKEINLIVGASQTSYPNWISTQKYCLDLANKDDFERVLGKRKINKLLAEHVLEHLDDTTLKLSLKNIDTFLKTGGSFRIAVPDGYHSNPNYIEEVKPGGTGAGSEDHKHLFTYQTLSRILTENGFEARLVEYWDETGQFHSNYNNHDGLGYIQRSFINDCRNCDLAIGEARSERFALCVRGQLRWRIRDRLPNYTSLIIDAIKKSH